MPDSINRYTHYRERLHLNLSWPPFFSFFPPMDRQKQFFLNLKDESKYFVDRTRLSIYTQDLFSWVCFPANSLSSTLSLCIIIPCEPCCCFTFTHQSLIPALPIQHDVWRSFSGLDSYSIYNSSSEVWIYIVLIRLLAWYMALCFLMITHNLDDYWYEIPMAKQPGREEMWWRTIWKLTRCSTACGGF